MVYIVRAESKNFILADHALERKVLSQLQTMSKKKVEEIAKVEAHERERSSTKAIGGAFCDAKSHIRRTSGQPEIRHGGTCSSLSPHVRGAAGRRLRSRRRGQGSRREPGR